MSHDKNTFHYWQSGLDYVYLMNGVKWIENDYGRFYQISDVDGLHDFLARKIIKSPASLRGQELRFLRAYLNMSQQGLASKMGVTRDAIAKREASPTSALSGEMDRLLRFICLSKKADKRNFEYMAEMLDDIAEQEFQRELELKHLSSGWALESPCKAA